MGRDNVGMSLEQRARLAEKGRILYRKSCGASGKKTCAESFAQHQINRGETEVARDLLAFLDGEVEALRTDDPNGRLAATEELAARIRGHLQMERVEPTKIRSGSDNDLESGAQPVGLARLSDLA